MYKSWSATNKAVCISVNCQSLVQLSQHWFAEFIFHHMTCIEITSNEPSRHVEACQERSRLVIHATATLLVRPNRPLQSRIPFCHKRQLYSQVWIAFRFDLSNNKLSKYKPVLIAIRFEPSFNANLRYYKNSRT